MSKISIKEKLRFILDQRTLWRTANSPSRTDTETTLLFAPTTSFRNYGFLRWKRRQILILGRERRVRVGVCTHIHREISEFLGQLFARIAVLLIILNCMHVSFCDSLQLSNISLVDYVSD